VIAAPLVRVVGLVATAGIAIAIAAPQSSTPERYHEKIEGTLVSFEMRLVPGGDVVVPSKDGDQRATVAPFYIGVTEVTWDLYDVFALGLDRGKATGQADAVARPSNPYGAPDYGWGHAGFPAISVTRAAAEAFCAWLSLKTGKAYRVPTEAQWTRAAELAAGGRAAVPPDRRAALAWHRGNASARTHAVATREPDALGLFDLFGNAAEWVAPADGTLVTRGGSFRDDEGTIGPAARAVQEPSWNETDPQLPKSKWWLSDAPFVGFRVVSDVGRAFRRGDGGGSHGSR
jgi:formylglycine-generating enzyme required for sulfatase activity